MMEPGKKNRKNQVEDEQFMKISDYSQGRSSNPNNSEVQEYPIDQFENYINKNHANAHQLQQLHQEKIQELTKECQKYFNDCQELTEKVNDLAQQLQQCQQSSINIDEVFNVLQWIQSQVAQYKQQFKDYREKQNLISQHKDKEIESLRKTVTNLQSQRDNLFGQKSELDERNNELQSQNSNLISEIQSLENELNEVRSIKSVSRMKKSKRTVFDDEIQAQLQTLVQKLMNELEVERKNNRNAHSQIRRMQEQILQLQRQVVSKSNKIYSLQMNNIKQKRQSPKNQSKYSMFQRSRSQKQLVNVEQKQNFKSKSDRHTILKNLRLDQILSDHLDLSEKQRYIIASKIAHFYIKKFDTADLEPYNPDQLFVCNFNKNNPSLITIKKDPDHTPYRQKTNPKVLSWNLGILLSKLLIEPTYESQFTDQSIELVHKSIDKFVHEENPNAKSVRQLKNFLEEVLRSID